MEMKNTAAAVFAAVMAVGSVSTVAFAKYTMKRTNSQGNRYLARSNKKGRYNIMKKTVVLLLFLAMLSFALFGCKSGKKFDSAEAMVSSMEGTYSASDGHSGEYIIINKEKVIKFNINEIFPEHIEEGLFDANFSDEDWGNFNIDVLLEKPYTKVSTEAVSADVKNSTLSGLWIDKDGTLYSSKEKEGYPFEKLSLESNFPTDEMKEKFESLAQSLQEYEIQSIIKGAEDNVSKKKTALDSQLVSATKTSSSKKECTASAKVIANCAFESIKSVFKYPASAELLDYTSTPQKDSYGRVATLIRCKYQNGFGNFITQDVYVVLQSCTETGEYTYKYKLNYLFDKGSTTDAALNLLFSGNDFDKDPDYNSIKNPTYLEAIELAKNGDYESAINKLETVKGYRSADDVIIACENYIHSQYYKNAVNLFADKKYSEATEKLASLITVDKDGNEVAYLKTKRIIYLCGYLSNGDAENNAASSKNDSQNNSDSIDSGSNSTDENSSGGDNIDSDNINSNNTESSNNTGDNNSGSNSTGGNNPGNNNTSGNVSVNPCVNGHTWQAVNSTIHHDQEGHYEMVKVEDGYKWYHCPICDDEFKSLDSYYSHFDSNHSDVPFLRNEYTHGSVYDQYEEMWIVDKEAYDETVIIGYKCSKCGATKQ